MARPKSVPLPPADFADRALPIQTIATGTRLVRMHRSDLEPLFFGTTGRNRFDDPTKAYGVCYLSMSAEGAFAETCLRSVGARFVQMSFLEARSFSDIEVTGPLQLVSLHGPGLAQLGATGAVSSGLHPPARQWSKAIHDHPSHPDGIAYRSNHDNGELCVAVFAHAGARLRIGAQRPILADRKQLAVLLNRYKFGLG